MKNRDVMEALATMLETTEFKPGRFHLHGFALSPKRLEGELVKFPGLSEFADNVPDSKFFEIITKREPGYGKPKVLECKTVACAIGWGLVKIPLFEQRGFCWSNATGYENSLTPIYGGKYGMDAIGKFFDISVHQTFHLFGPEHYTEEQQYQPKVVAARIRVFLANNPE